MPQAARITGLFVYPVKGCQGTALEEAVLGARGLAFDRHWMIVDPAGRFLTQRELPRLAAIRPHLSDEALGLDLAGARRLELPLRAEGSRITVRVWSDTLPALAVAAEADEALSRFLGRPVRLIRFDESQRRVCDEAYAPAGAHTAFADGFPLLVANEGSLAALNAALAEQGAPPVPMSRFRPNLVLGDAPAGAEDRYPGLLVGDAVRLDLVKPCDRCVVTTIDQASGRSMGQEPIRTLARIRRNPRTRGVWFGQNAVPRLADGATAVLRMGDVCRLIDG